MKILMVISALFLAQAYVYCQQTDAPDFRRKVESFVKIQEKDIRTDLASFTYGGVDESVGKLPLAFVPAIGLKNNVMRFADSTTEVTIQTKPFDLTKHKLGFYEVTFLQKIDNKAFYGGYGQLPKTSIEAITVIIEKDTIHLPTTAFADIYNPNFVYKDGVGTIRTHNGVYKSADGKKLYIYLGNREASDRWEVTWIIQDKKYLKRVIDYNLD